MRTVFMDYDDKTYPIGAPSCRQSLNTASEGTGNWGILSGIISKFPDVYQQEGGQHD